MSDAEVWAEVWAEIHRQLTESIRAWLDDQAEWWEQQKIQMQEDRP